MLNLDLSGMDFSCVVLRKDKRSDRAQVTIEFLLGPALCTSKHG